MTAQELVAGATCAGGLVVTDAPVQCQFACAQGYELDTSSGLIDCAVDGGLWPDHPVCVPSSCSTTEIQFSSNHETSSSISGVTGDEITVSCKQGYVGGGIVTCQESGRFNTEVAQCIAIPCDATSVLYSDFADANSVTGATGTTVSITCDTGYSGGGNIECLNTGQFEETTCTPNECQSTSVDFSDFDTDNSVQGVTGDIITITCSRGYSGGGTSSTLLFCDSHSLSAWNVINPQTHTQVMSLVKQTGNSKWQLVHPIRVLQQVWHTVTTPLQIP